MQHKKRLEDEHVFTDPANVFAGMSSDLPKKTKLKILQQRLAELSEP